MKNILLPTDFSDNAYNAIKYAALLFKDEPCKFLLLNNIYNSEFILYGDLYEIYKENAITRLENIKERITKEFPNKKHEYRVTATFNLLYEEIKERVANKEVDLIVMGTEGAKGGEEILFGTHTAHAIKVANCPVLSIPSGYSYKIPQNILFPNDYKLRFKDLNLDILKDIAEDHHSTVNILHETFGHEPSGSQEELQADLNNYLGEINHYFHHARTGSVIGAIEEFKETLPAEMIVMVKNKHTFIEKIIFKSVVRHVSYYIKLPFLVLPSENYKQTDPESNKNFQLN